MASLSRQCDPGAAVARDGCDREVRARLAVVTPPWLSAASASNADVDAWRHVHTSFRRRAVQPGDVASPLLLWGLRPRRAGRLGPARARPGNDPPTAMGVADSNMVVELARAVCGPLRTSTRWGGRPSRSRDRSRSAADPDVAREHARGAAVASGMAIVPAVESGERTEWQWAGTKRSGNI